MSNTQLFVLCISIFLAPHTTHDRATITAVIFLIAMLIQRYRESK